MQTQTEDSERREEGREGKGRRRQGSFNDGKERYAVMVVLMGGAVADDCVTVLTWPFRAETRHK